MSLIECFDSAVLFGTAMFGFGFGFLTFEVVDFLFYVIKDKEKNYFKIDKHENETKEK